MGHKEGQGRTSDQKTRKVRVRRRQSGAKTRKQEESGDGGGGEVAIK